LWGNFGFYDAFNQSRSWVAGSYLAIDQGPIIDMIENERTQLLWNLFMANPEIQPMLDAIGFVSDNTGIAELQSWPATVLPNPCINTLIINSSNALSCIVVTNITGQEVLRIDHKNDGKDQIDVSGLKRGVYLVSLYNLKGNKVIRKIVKQ
jgi:hypothetical protein